jgi:hypothetical protein
MTRLDYNEDNFFGTESRGTRYDIYVDGNLYFQDVNETEVDRLCETYERKGYSVEVVER